MGNRRLWTHQAVASWVPAPGPPIAVVLLPDLYKVQRTLLELLAAQHACPRGIPSVAHPGDRTFLLPHSYCLATHRLGTGIRRKMSSRGQG